MGGALRGLSFSESIYFSINTISTVGYGDIIPYSNLARLLSSLEVFCGIMPWEHGPLDPEEGGPGSLRDALLAMMDGKDEVHDGGLAGRAQRRPEAAGG